MNSCMLHNAVFRANKNASFPWVYLGHVVEAVYLNLMRGITKICRSGGVFGVKSSIRVARGVYGRRVSRL